LKTKIIGTGLTGLVGSRIVELLNDKFEFIDFSLDKGINILDQNSLSQAFASHQDAVAVIHLAAFTDTNAAWPKKTINILFIFLPTLSLTAPKLLPISNLILLILSSGMVKLNIWVNKPSSTLLALQLSPASPTPIGLILISSLILFTKF